MNRNALLPSLGWLLLSPFSVYPLVAMPAITQATKLERKQNVPDEDRTPGREIVADFIESEILDEWPVPLTEVAERTAELEQAPEDGYSRQHIHNTISAFYDVVEDDENTIQTEQSITIPEDVESESYIRGWLADHQK